MNKCFKNSDGLIVIFRHLCDDDIITRNSCQYNLGTNVLLIGIFLLKETRILSSDKFIGIVNHKSCFLNWLRPTYLTKEEYCGFIYSWINSRLVMFADTEVSCFLASAALFLVCPQFIF